MKLRNKKTGEIKEYGSVGATTFANGGVLEAFAVYDSLAALNEEWEDYEEPKESYYIDCDGEIYEPVRLTQSDLNNMTSIGNYFETRHDAVRAVLKLMAWKRLKDIGFKFIGKSYEYKEDKNFGSVFFETGSHEKIREIYKDNVDFYDDLDLLFGGKE